MFKLLFPSLVCALFLAQPRDTDQFLLILSSSKYPIFKATEYAASLGFEYIKMISYEFESEGHHCKWETTSTNFEEGEIVTFSDEYVSLTLRGYHQKPKDPLAFPLKR